MKQTIIKFLYGDISDHDIKVLRVWLENPKNNKKFKKQVRLFYLMNNKFDQQSIDSAYQKHLASINTTIVANKKPRKRFQLWIKYGAVACIMIGAIYLYTERSNTQKMAKNHFPIGTDKAILTLSNGKSISLHKGESFTNAFITSTGEKLVYKDTATAKTKRELHYNYLTIPRGGQFFMKLSDGTKVWLNSESKIKYPVKFLAGQTRFVELIYGEAYFKVSKSTKHNGTAFNVKINEQNIAVLGTEFNVKAYKDETNILTTLIKGSVAVSNSIDTEILHPGEQAKLCETTSKFKIYPVQVEDEIAWRDGVFSFTNKPLYEIMKVIARWYNLHITIVNNKTKNIKFTGVLKKQQSIHKILEAIQSTTNIEYTFNDKNLMIK
ncbi:MAG: FecR family protein [Polaribacter sp.]